MKNKKMTSKIENLAFHLALISALYQGMGTSLQAAPASKENVEQYYSSLGIKTPEKLFQDNQNGKAEVSVQTIAATTEPTQNKIEWVDTSKAQEKSAAEQDAAVAKASISSASALVEQTQALAPSAENSVSIPAALAPLMAPAPTQPALSNAELNKEEELSKVSILELKKKYLPVNVGGSVPSNEAPRQKAISVESAVMNRDPDRTEISVSSKNKNEPSVHNAFSPIPKPKASEDIAGSMTSKNSIEDANGRDQNQISITNSRNPRRGINIKAEVPSVKHLTMSPASKKFGGDDVEIVISPIYEVLIQMPDAIEDYKSSSSLLVPTLSVNNPQLLTLKLSKVTSPTPISLHVVDISQNIYTFTIVGVPADLSWEYPKTIIITKRSAEKTDLGGGNPKSIDDALNVDDAIQVTVGDKVNTDEYKVQFLYGNFMHYKGYVLYAFRISRKDETAFKRDKSGNPILKFTAWANNKKLDAGSLYGGEESGLPRDIEWTIQPVLSKRDSRRAGHEVLAVMLQIRASILDLEEWTSAFITVSDDESYSRHDFDPIMRTSRAPVKSIEGDDGN